MKIYIKDLFNNEIRLTDERITHFKKNHPVFIQIYKWKQFVEETLSKPDKVIKSKTDEFVNLYYRYFLNTVAGDKYLCVVVKKDIDYFVITVYFTDKVKEGVIIWKK